MSFNQEYLQEFLSLCTKTEEMKKEINGKIKAILKEKLKMEGKGDNEYGRYEVLHYVQYGLDVIKGSMAFHPVSWCSDTDYEGFSFPTNFLYRDDWKEELGKLVEEEKRELELEEMKQREEEAKWLEEEEREEWERLNAKFGTNKEGER